MGVDELEKDEMGVDILGSRRRGVVPSIYPHLIIPILYM